jgi:hypothetical protein
MGKTAHLEIEPERRRGSGDARQRLRVQAADIAGASDTAKERAGADIVLTARLLGNGRGGAGRCEFFVLLCPDRGPIQILDFCAPVQW